MTDDLGACGSGGWTLAMKMDGHKVCNNIRWLYTRAWPKLSQKLAKIHPCIVYLHAA